MNVDAPGVPRRLPRGWGWRAWDHPGFAVAIVLVLGALGLANMLARARSSEVEDGVFWATRPGGVTAAAVASGSAAAHAGIEPGDVLVAIDGTAVDTRDAVIGYQHRARQGTRLAYVLTRRGARRAVEVVLAPVSPPGSMYFVLAAVGLFTLLVGGSARLRRPRDQATLHFFWLCVAFFGWFTFSFTGPFDPLDWVFYWGDVVATALVPPLLLHFTLSFPDRPRSRGTRLLVPAIYLPAIALIAGRIAALAGGSADGPRLSRMLDVLDRVELVYLTLCVVAAVVVVARAFRNVRSVTGRRQLRWRRGPEGVLLASLGCRQPSVRHVQQQTRYHPKDGDGVSVDCSCLLSCLLTHNYRLYPFC